MLLVQFLFWLCTALVFHSYVVYPFVLKVLSRNTRKPLLNDDYKPEVHIIMAVYNAESIIEEKVKSILASNYPISKIKIWIGSDCSTDLTDTRLRELSKEYPALDITYLDKRSGKIAIINTLYERVIASGLKDKIIISTDVTAMFDADCIKHLLKYFCDPLVAAVGANIIKQNLRSDGISGQEKAYYNRELLMKKEEGELWGSAIGVFGACYAIRPEDFSPVPPAFLSDDFYITMQILSKGRKVLYDMDARVFMNLANESSIEFKRKVRISAGNFQNLTKFWKLLFRFNGLSFAFFSHKVLRWFGPFLMIITLFTSYYLQSVHWIYGLALIVQLGLFAFPLINYIMEKMQLHNRLVKFVAHFYLMNLGILLGFFKYARGVKSSIWEPTKR